MRKVLSVVLAATMAMSLAACGGSGAKTDTKAAAAGTAAGAEASADDYYITIKFSNVFQPAEWNYKASEYLADLVKEKTDGHITLEYYGQNQLDCYAESVAQAHNGAVWMGLEEPSYFADYIGDYNVLVGPMLYKNNAEYNAVMDSDIVKDLNAKLASEHNIHVLDTRMDCRNEQIFSAVFTHNIDIIGTGLQYIGDCSKFFSFIRNHLYSDQICNKILVFS